MTSLVTAFVPAQYHGTTFEETAVVNGNRTPKKYQQRDHNGHAVIDIPLGFFNRMLGGPQGKLWLDANPELVAWLGEADRRDMFCNAFPGEHRAPSVVPSAPAAPVMVSMRAPENITGCSVEGAELAIPDDRIVTVTESVADALRSHGFQNVA
jgi:hypothetical protein